MVDRWAYRTGGRRDPGPEVARDIGLICEEHGDTPGLFFDVQGTGRGAAIDQRFCAIPPGRRHADARLIDSLYGGSKWADSADRTGDSVISATIAARMAQYAEWPVLKGFCTESSTNHPWAAKTV